MHSPAEFDRLLAGVGLEPLRGRTLGFGPFTLMRRPVLHGRPAVTVHRRLQALADRGLPGLRSTGSQYMVLARGGGAETAGRVR
jgi:hypothetical protein